MVTCWIYVEDRLPRTKEVYYGWYRSDDVLVYQKSGKICVAHASSEEDDSEVMWRTSDSESWELDDVTHWMPLPQPPQGE